MKGFNDIWIESYIEGFKVDKSHYYFYEYLSSQSLWFKERLDKLVPESFKERRNATMLEF